LDRPPAPPRSPQDQQHWFQLVFESTSDLMAMHRVEPDGRLVFEHLNRSLRAYHALARPGVDSSAWIGRDLSDVMLNDLGFEPARCAAMLETYRQAVSTGKVTPVSHVAGVGATARHREGVITPLKDSSGRVTHLFYRGEDITERLQAESELRLSAERFAKVFDLSPTPIVVGAVEDGRYLAVNEAWLQLHGYRREELEGHGSLSLGVWAEPAERARMVEMISSGREVRRLPVRFRKKSGEVFESLYSATLADWKGESAIIATPQDVTELRRATAEIRVLNETLEERVAQRTRALEEANRQLEAFSYSVSHDLRAPLRAISGFSEMLAQRPGLAADAEGADYARRVSAAASRMGTIVDALLKFSRLSRQGIASRRVDLAAQVQAIIADFAEAAEGRELRWAVGSLPAVEGDPTLLRLVMENLLDNAVKYTARRSDPLIEVDATCENGVATIRVRDNGIGFDMKYAAKVFGVFERLHADDVEFEGTGIGLANAQRIVERHGGRIWCESAPGEGACFYFTLPLGQARKV
jgi:PAS domain S-box-containing protein